MGPAAQQAAGASLEALRDIHLPEPVSFWPPAPGWWLLAAVVMAAVVAVLLVRRSRHRRPMPWNEAAARELAAIEASFAEHGDALELATALSALLRRAALARYPAEEVAALHGDEWYALLCRHASADGPCTPEVAREITHAAWGDIDEAKADPERWIAFVRAWIEEQG